ncbi:TPR-like protein [Imleria badia]|nr:TPR-like protein [Imleria badia]
MDSGVTDCREQPQQVVSELASTCGTAPLIVIDNVRPEATGDQAADDHEVGQSRVESYSTLISKSEDPGVLGARFLSRFDQFGDVADLEQAISFLETGVQSTPIEDAQYSGMLTLLGAALLHRFNKLGGLDNLEQAISRFREAVQHTMDVHPSKHDYLNNLATSIITRFKHSGELSDLDEGISTYRKAIRLIPDGHPNKPRHLNNLADFFVTRFQRLGELSDFEAGMSMHTAAASLLPEGHPDKPGYLNDLANSLLARFKRLGELDYLQQAISQYTLAVEITPDNHPNKPDYLSNLGNSFVTRFGRLGESSDLDRGISTHMQAIKLTPDGHPNKTSHLHNISNAFTTRFQCFGELSDLEQVIALQRETIELVPEGHPHKPRYLNNLANSFFTRFKRLGEPSDLEQAISRHTAAAVLTPDAHPDKPLRLNHLFLSLITRFERLGELGDLEQAISRLKEAIDYAHPDKPNTLSNLGNSLFTRFQRLGERSDLKQAISRHREAIELTADSHPNKPRYQNNLANCFFTSFNCLGEPSDLEQAISWHMAAVELSDGRPDKHRYLSNLATSLLARFKRVGELNDLELAISRHREAVELTPDVHPNKPDYLCNLANSTIVRFERLGELGDLEQAISTQTTVIELTSNYPEKSGHLSNLANSLIARFDRLGELRDLEQAVSRHTEAVELTPDVHPAKLARLNNLGVAFLSRFQRLGELNDLDQALAIQRKAVQLTLDGHPNKPGYLSNLANSFIIRFERLGELSDLEQAISRHREALQLTPHAHPDKYAQLINLADSFVTRFKRLGEPNDLEQAILQYSHVARAFTGNTSNRFYAAQRWILHARNPRHHSLLDAYSTAIGLLPQLAWIGFVLAHRYDELLQGAGLAREGAEIALELGRPELAVEWLEQGRSVVWGDLFQLRSSFDELSSAYPKHAHKLRRLSAELEHVGATRDKSLTSLSQQNQGTGNHSTQQEADRHRALAIERDRLLQVIRGMPGFERFLLHKEFSQLRAAARSGPVVFLNAAKMRCDALIVLFDMENVIHVPLPDFTLKRSGALSNTMDDLLGHARVILCEDRDGQRASRRQFSWESILSPLWKGVVKPILDALGISTPGELSRIFWCPTGPFTFLPIHAAGLYGTQYSEPGHKVFDFVISSYVPTLNILTPPPIRDTASSRGFRVLAIPQPPSDGQSRLPGVHTELEYIKAVVSNACSTQITLLASSEGTVEEVLALMKDADWVHFACHGIQDSENPTDSGLCLANERRLKLSDIIALSRPRGGLAFLSACQTAMGDKKLSDEAIHIAAGMLFAGYGGAVGTMWSISDRVAPAVAKDVYEQLVQTGETPDYLDAARALHNAVRRLRENNASFVEWLPFIHVIHGLPGFERFLLHKEFSQSRAAAQFGPVVILNATKVRCDALVVLADKENVIHVPLPDFTRKRSGALSNTIEDLLGHSRVIPCEDRDGQRASRRQFCWEFILSSLRKGVVKPVLGVLGISHPFETTRPTVISAFWLSLNHLSDGQSRLPGVQTELEYIRTLIGSSQSAQIILVESFAGTVEEPQRAPLKADCLANELRLTLSDIIALSRPRAGFAFLSACQAAMGDNNLSDEAVHIAAGMLFVGYGGVLATMWSISDRVAPLVAKDVYEQLFRTGATPNYREAAGALHNAVGRLRERGVSFVEWLPFIHVGL